MRMASLRRRERRSADSRDFFAGAGQRSVDAEFTIDPNEATRSSPTRSDGFDRLEEVISTTSGLRHWLAPLLARCAPSVGDRKSRRQDARSNRAVAS